MMRYLEDESSRAGYKFKRARHRPDGAARMSWAATAELTSKATRERGVDSRLWLRISASYQYRNGFACRGCLFQDRGALG